MWKNRNCARWQASISPQPVRTAVWLGLGAYLSHVQSLPRLKVKLKTGVYSACPLLSQNKNWGWREALWFAALATFTEDPVLSPSTHCSSQPPVTPVPGDLPSTGTRHTCGRQAQMWANAHTQNKGAGHVVQWYRQHLTSMHKALLSIPSIRWGWGGYHKETIPIDQLTHDWSVTSCYKWNMAPKFWDITKKVNYGIQRELIRKFQIGSARSIMMKGGL